MWLNDAMIVNPCYNSTDPNIGLSLNNDYSTRKCYLMDTGLLVTQTFMDGSYTDNEIYKAILFNKLNINEGMIMKNIVAQTLRTSGHKLFFYSRYDKEKKGNDMELDFRIKDGVIHLPIYMGIFL